MPIYEYRCTACEAEFELLVRSDTVPACPQCTSQALDRKISVPAAPGFSKALLAAGRKAAAREGHFSNYSREERSKVGKS